MKSPQSSIDEEVGGILVEGVGCAGLISSCTVLIGSGTLLIGSGTLLIGSCTTSIQLLLLYNYLNKFKYILL